MSRSHVLKKMALTLSGALLVLASAGAPQISAAVAQPVAAVSADAVRTALAATEYGDLRQVEALLTSGGVQGPALPLLEARQAAARLRFGEARAALDRYFATRDTDRERLFLAYEVAAGVAFLDGRFGEAARHAGTLLGMAVGKPQDRIDGLRQMLEIGALLANEPAQAVERQGDGTPVFLMRDKVGLLRAPVAVGGVVQEAVLDTGANVSVVSASAAERLGLRTFDGASSIGNSVGGDVGIRLGIADRLELGGAVVRNVVFAVMDDAALEFPVPGGYRIDAIIGLPVLRAIGRMEFNLDEKALRVTPTRAAPPEHANMRVIGNNPYVMMTIAGVELPIFFDTGANSSYLYPQFAEKVPDIAPVDSGKMAGRAGAGGVTHVKKMHYANLPVGIGGYTVDSVAITYEPDGSGDPDRPLGMLGVDTLSRFEFFAFDFGTMVLEVGPPRVAGGAATATR